MKKAIQANKKSWDQRASLHVHSEFYDVIAFKGGKCSLKEIELALLPDLHGLRVLHLQCHFGQDSLELARNGAQVTAVDFSEKAISIAKEMAAEMKLDVRFICADVNDPALLKGEKFDLVFMSYGVLVWHEDLGALAELISGCLDPDGRFLLVEFHPFMQMYDDTTEQMVHSYFMDGPISGEEEGSYAEKGSQEKISYTVWNHSLGEIMNSFLGAGLNLEYFQEYDFSPYPCFENLVNVGESRWMLEGMEGKIPMCFAMRMKGV